MINEVSTFQWFRLARFHCNTKILLIVVFTVERAYCSESLLSIVSRAVTNWSGLKETPAISLLDDL